MGDAPPRSASAVPPDRASTPPFSTIETRRLGPIRRWFAAHPRGTDIIVSAWFFVPSLLQIAFPTQRPVVHWALVAITTAVLLWRRHQPVAVLGWVIVGAALSSWLVGGTGGQEFAAALAVYAVAAHRPARTAWIATIVTVLALAGLGWLSLDTYMSEAIDQGQDPEVVATRLQVFAGVASWTTVVTLVAHALGINVRARRLHTQDLVDRANRIALERDQRAQLAAADERARIAREMHDVVAHSVSVMVTLADGAGASLDKNPEQSRRALKELSATGRDALAEMRTILGVLRSGPQPEGEAPFDGPAPLAPTAGDLDDLLARFRSAGLAVERVDRGGALPAQRAFALTVYRVVQESLTNVLRYAPGATTVRVEIDRGPDAVVIDVVNDAGTGSRTQPGSGNGLIGLRERVAAIGGTATAGPDGRGWRVHAALPLPTEDVAAGLTPTPDRTEEDR